MDVSLTLVLFVFIIHHATAFRGFASLFGKVDKNHDGGLSSRELVVIGNRFGIHSSVILEALKMTDVDGNRVLNPSEFEKLQDSIDGTGQIRGRASSSRFNTSAVSRMLRSHSEVNVDARNRNTAQPIVVQLLKIFDSDKDGKFSQQEVAAMFAQHGMPFSVAEEAFRMADRDGDDRLDALGTVILSFPLQNEQVSTIMPIRSGSDSRNGSQLIQNNFGSFDEDNFVGRYSDPSISH